MESRRINEDQVRDLKTLPIREVAKRLGLTLDHSRTLCLWHADKHPSLYLDDRPGRNSFKCYSCGAHGDVVDLTKKVLGVGFRDACAWLAGGESMIREAYQPAPTWERRPFDEARYARYLMHPMVSPEHMRWLTEVRGYSAEWARWLRLNSYRDWLQAGYWSQDGRRLLAVESRYMGTDPNQKRFRFAPGSSCHTYNLPILNWVMPGEDIYLAEGLSDTWCHLTAGHKCLGIGSATLLRESELTPLKGRTVRYAPDRDEAGAMLTDRLQRAADRIGFTLITEALPEDCKDFSDYWRKRNGLDTETQMVH